MTYALTLLAAIVCTFFRMSLGIPDRQKFPKLPYDGNPNHYVPYQRNGSWPRG
jgi:hypothetical protein